MASVQFTEKDLCELVGARLEARRLEEAMEGLGMPVDAFEDGTFTVDITPNRIDLLSVEGMARAIAAFTNEKPGLREYRAEESGYALTIDKSVRGVRPYMVMALVKGVEINESLLKSIINIQEKVHDTFGRKRKKVSIGIHDADRVHAPFTYLCMKQHEFIPLDRSEKMTCSQILNEHEKGVAYAHLVEKGKFPLLVDKDGEVLSFPPIINGELTRVTSNTRNLLIDITGTSQQALSDALNVICALLADRGAKIYSVKTTDGITPDLAPRETKFDLKKACKLLGAQVSEGDAVQLLQRMGHKYENGVVYSPCYRADIIHWVDVAEDLAIALDYNKLPNTLPGFASIGAPLESHAHARQALLGLGYMEAVTFTLTNKTTNFEMVGLPAGEIVDTLNPLTVDYTSLRTHLLPSLLAVLASNKTQPFPQKLFEIGKVYEDAKSLAESGQLCALSSHSHASFAEAKSALEALAGELGIQISLEPKDHPSLEPGRSCEVKVDGKVVGFVGEVSAPVLKNFDLEQKVAGFWLKVDEPSAKPVKSIDEMFGSMPDFDIEGFRKEHEKER